MHEPFEIFNVTEEDEDARKLIKFARKKIPHYTPSAGYAYYEFTKRGYVLPERNVLALRKVKLSDHEMMKVLFVDNLFTRNLPCRRFDIDALYIILLILP